MNRAIMLKIALFVRIELLCSSIRELLCSSIRRLPPNGTVELYSYE